MFLKKILDFQFYRDVSPKHASDDYFLNECFSDTVRETVLLGGVLD